MTTYYLFTGVDGKEALKLAFTSRQTIHLCSSKTGFRFVDVSDKFYDTEVEKDKCMAMPDEEFDATIIKTFAMQGYRFVQKDEHK